VQSVQQALDSSVSRDRASAASIAIPMPTSYLCRIFC